MTQSQSNTVGVLASGGLDSAILVSYLLEKGHVVQPFYVNSGLYWQLAEFAGLQSYLSAIAAGALANLVQFELPLDDLYAGHWSLTGRRIPGAETPDAAVYLPGRNLLLAIKPALWCQMNGIGQLALGVLGSNPFDDATDDFFATLENVLSRLGQSALKIIRPFGKLHKDEVMQLGRNYPLGLSFSCINPIGGLHCGQCNKCAERKAAFRAIRLHDPTMYA
ncbi:MAG TPA: 7-cyano-7-deazaguanine synthase [Pirellulales bacterium]|jgi:7-cyano-7-deazaguanine synthase